MSEDPEPGKASPIYQISTSEAQTLAELSSIKLDLSLARDYLLEGLSVPTSKIKMALFSAAHVSYRRAFNRGPVGLAVADVESLGPDDTERHHFHYDQVNRLVTCSENAFEDCKVGVTVKNRTFESVRTIGQKYVGLSNTNAENWIVLISRLEDGPLDRKINKAYEAVENWPKTQPVAEIEKAPIIGSLESCSARSTANKSGTSS